MDDTGITVTQDYLEFRDSNTDKANGWPWSPAPSFTDGFGVWIETIPTMSWYDVQVNGAGGVDFESYENSFEIYSRNGYGAITSVFFNLSGGSATGRGNYWNPCENNTLNLSFNHERTIVVPSGGWGISTPENVVSGYLRVFDAADASDAVVEISPILNYSRATGHFSNGFKVEDQAGVETTYNFGNTSTNSAAIDIKLIITPVAPTTTSPVKNRWKLEFDVTGGGTSITIPSYEFELPYDARFGVDNTLRFQCNTGNAADRYKVTDLAISLSDTVIP